MSNILSFTSLNINLFSFDAPGIEFGVSVRRSWGEAHRVYNSPLQLLFAIDIPFWSQFTPHIKGFLYEYILRIVIFLLT